jgi:uncharacterized protein YndB with AHSA1/START domain
MATIESQLQISAPPEEVFAYLSDLEKHPEWSHCMEIKKTSEGPVGVGTTYQSKGKNFGITANETVEVTEYRPSERFAWLTKGALGMKFGWSFDLSPKEGGTLVTELFEPPTGFVGSLISTLTGSSTRKAMEEGLANIKEKLEGSRGESTQARPEESLEERIEVRPEGGEEGSSEGGEEPS